MYPLETSLSLAQGPHHEVEEDSQTDRILENTPPFASCLKSLFCFLLWIYLHRQCSIWYF